MNHRKFKDIEVIEKSRKKNENDRKWKYMKVNENHRNMKNKADGIVENHSENKNENQDCDSWCFKHS